MSGENESISNVAGNYGTFQNPETGATETLREVQQSPASDLEDAVCNTHSHSPTTYEDIKKQRMVACGVVVFAIFFLYTMVAQVADWPHVDLGFVYCGILVVGGLMGFVKKRSYVSLAAGTIFGLLYLAASYQSGFFGAAVSFALVLVGLVRLYAARGPVPAILIAVGSSGLVYYLVLVYNS